MRTGNVREFCERLWDLRETAAGCVPAGMTISRMLALAVADDVLRSPEYDPEADKRVAWCRAVAAARTLHPQARPAGSAELEHCVAWLLDRQVVPASGKMRGAEGTSNIELQTSNEEWKRNEPVTPQLCP